MSDSSKKCFSYKELKNIQGRDNGEPLVDVGEEAPILAFSEPPIRMIPYTGTRFYLRKGLVSRLITAQSALQRIDVHYQLQLCYAYRHPEVQKNSFERFMEQARLSKPELSEEDLYEYAHHYIAIPDVGGHPAGAAVDVTVLHNGIALNMGSALGDLTDMEKVPTFSDAITLDQQQNRILLRDAMVHAGFAPYDFEWWHFSYGDREWACYYGNRESLYEPMLFSLSAAHQG